MTGAMRLGNLIGSSWRIVSDSRQRWLIVINGVVALSLALSTNMKDKGRYKEIPTDEYPPIEQACVILSSSKNKEIAQRFLSYFKSAVVGDLLAAYGFDVSSRTSK